MRKSTPTSFDFSDKIGNRVGKWWENEFFLLRTLVLLFVVLLQKVRKDRRMIVRDRGVNLRQVGACTKLVGTIFHFVTPSVRHLVFFRKTLRFCSSCGFSKSQRKLTKTLLYSDKPFRNHNFTLRVFCRFFVCNWFTETPNFPVKTKKKIQNLFDYFKVIKYNSKML